MKDSPPEILRFLARSDDRITILTALTTDASFTRSELQTETGVPRSTLSRILNELEDRELVSSVGHRCEVTPFGRFLAERLHSVFDAIEVMQRLQTLLKQLPDTDHDVTFTDHAGSEILTPTSADPGASTRRFADLLHAASRVRLLIPAAISVLFEVDPAIGSEKRTFEVVIPRVALEMKRDNPRSSQQLRDAIVPGEVTLFAYDGDIPHFAGTIDEVAVVGLTDDAGTIRGHIETSDETARSWTEAIVTAYRRDADSVPM